MPNQRKNKELIKEFLLYGKTLPVWAGLEKFPKGIGENFYGEL